MSHIDLRYTVQGSIVSTDATLLDAIEDALPADDAEALGNEYSVTRTDVEDSEKERLSGRMTFTADSFELEDGATVSPREAAESVYQDIVNHDLAAKADNWKVKLYRSPEGGVLAEDVRKWYQEDESRQPTRTDEDGIEVSYIPSSWNPNNHVLKEESA